MELKWSPSAVLLVLAFPCLASAAVIGGIETPGIPPTPPASAPSIARSTTAVLINFDDVPQPCVFIETTALRAEYAGLGVTFEGPGISDGGGILNQCGSFGVAGHSPPNFLAFNTAALFSDGGVPRTPETLHFAIPVSQVSVLAAAYDGGIVSMRAYDASSTLVSGQTIVAGATVQLMTVSGPGIVRVVIDGPSVFILDDLAYDYGIVTALNATWGRLKTIYR